MLSKNLARALILIINCLLVCAPLGAVTIDINYASGTLFSASADAQAKAAINAAAADISAAITTSLNAINTSTFVGENASTDVTFDWDYSYTNPSNGTTSPILSPSLSADEITIFVGTRSLSGSTLGVGGPSGYSLGLGASGVPSQSPAAVADAEAQSQTELSRGGGGPTISNVAGTWDWSGYTEDYTVDLGIAYGSLSFDIDIDNNGSHDSAAALDSHWHWDHTSSVAFGKNDLYSVAVHEILHAIGYGTADSWDDLVNGTNWNGSEVQALTGSGSGLIHPDGAHVAFNIMSQRLSDGAMQEVSMDPNLTTGTRKELTVLDLAFLRDIGYETITPTFPSPPDYDGDGDVDADDLQVMFNWYGVNGNGDADNDGDTDNADLLYWYRGFTGATALSVAADVPEPNGLALLLLAAVSLSYRRLS